MRLAIETSHVASWAQHVIPDIVGDLSESESPFGQSAGVLVDSHPTCKSTVCITIYSRSTFLILWEDDGHHTDLHSLD
jgi:hypothetical protein